MEHLRWLFLDGDITIVRISRIALFKLILNQVNKFLMKKYCINPLNASVALI